MDLASHPEQLRPLQSQANPTRAGIEHFHKGFSGGYEYMFYEIYPGQASIWAWLSGTQDAQQLEREGLTILKILSAALSRLPG